MSEIKKFNLGKTVKKWFQQGKDVVQIYSILNSSGHKCSVQDCINAYYDYMGWQRVIPERSGREIITAIMNRGKVHIYGSTGVGKTFTINAIAKELKLDMVVSYARLNEDLIKDWGTTPFEEDDRLFVLEGDAFYWKAYGVVKDYIARTKSAMVIITTQQKTPTKNITKLLKQFKIFPPSKTDMYDYIIQFDPNWKGNIDKIYDRDQRITWRNYLYNKADRTPPFEGFMDAKTIAYKILKGTATREDFDKSVHPWHFVLGWISYNAMNFYNKNGRRLEEVLSTLSWIDTYKFNYKKEYLIHVLLDLPPADKKGMMVFPPYKLNKVKEDKVETKEYVIEKYKKKGVKKTKKKPKQTKIVEESVEDEDDFEDDLGDFMLL